MMAAQMIAFRAFPRRMAHVIGLTAMVLGFPAAAAVHAEDVVSLTDRPLRAGDVLLRARISGIVPYDVESQISVIGGQVEVPRLVLPDVDVTYFLTDKLAITGQTGALKTDIKIRDTLFGDQDVGSIWAIPLAVSLEYHFFSEERFSPYIGAGLIATWYTGAKPASSSVPDFSVAAQLAPTFRLGADYRFNENWLMNFEMKQVLPPTQVITNSGVTARTDLKTISAGLGIGYRF
jgi:outer membrane protein